MALQHVITHTWTDGGRTITKSVTSSGSGVLSIDEDVADSQTDKQLTAAIDISALKSLFMLSDQAVTIETNDGSAPDDIFTLAANVPLTWDSQSGQANPFTADVTALFVTNASGESARIQIEALTDVTP